MPKITHYNNRWWVVDGDTMTVLDNSKEYELKEDKKDGRSLAQNSAQYLWFRQIADKLNIENVPTTQVIKADISWDSEKVKSLFFVPVMRVLYNKTSTTKLNKDEYTLIIQTMVKAFAEKGFELPPFPSIDDKLFQQNYGGN